MHDLHRRAARILGLCALALWSAGCDQLTPRERRLQQQLDESQHKLRAAQNQLADRDAIIEQLEERISAGHRLSDVSLDDLFVVDHIQILGQSGGADFDGAPGDDGVIVYVRPMDAAGNAIKAAGEITVRLYDLSTPGKPVELQSFVFNQRDQLSKAWFGGLLTDHYSLKCIFDATSPRPRTREVQVRVTFLDWLTGRMFTDAKAVRISRIDR